MRVSATAFETDGGTEAEDIVTEGETVEAVAATEEAADVEAAESAVVATVGDWMSAAVQDEEFGIGSETPVPVPVPDDQSPLPMAGSEISGTTAPVSATDAPEENPSDEPESDPVADDGTAGASAFCGSAWISPSSGNSENDGSSCDNGSSSDGGDASGSSSEFPSRPDGVSHEFAPDGSRRIDTPLVLVEYEKSSTKAPKESKSDNLSFSLLSAILVSVLQNDHWENGSSTADVGKTKTFQEASATEYPPNGKGSQEGLAIAKYSSVASSEVFAMISEKYGDTAETGAQRKNANEKNAERMERWG